VINIDIVAFSSTRMTRLEIWHHQRTTVATLVISSRATLSMAAYSLMWSVLKKLIVMKLNTIHTTITARRYGQSITITNNQSNVQQNFKNF